MRATHPYHIPATSASTDFANSRFHLPFVALVMLNFCILLIQFVWKSSKRSFAEQQVNLLQADLIGLLEYEVHRGESDDDIENLTDV